MFIVDVNLWGTTWSNMGVSPECSYHTFLKHMEPDWCSWDLYVWSHGIAISFEGRLTRKLCDFCFAQKGVRVSCQFVLPLPKNKETSYSSTVRVQLKETSFTNQQIWGPRKNKPFVGFIRNYLKYAHDQSKTTILIGSLITNRRVA